MKNLTQEEIKFLLKGSSILSTGGGGSINEAQKILNELDLQEVQLADPEDFDENKKVFTCYGVGSTASDDVDEIKSVEAAIKALQSETDKELEGVYPAEMGPLALVDALIVAEKLELPLLNMDAADGRCVPKIEMNPLIELEEEGTPFLITHQCDDKQKFEDINNLKQLEKEARHLASKKESIVFVSGHVHTIGKISEAMKKGTLEEALKIGKSAENIESLEKKTELEFLSTGKIEEVSVKKENKKFLEAEIKLSSEKSELCIHALNEFTKLERDGKVIAENPEMIVMVDLENTNGVYTGEKLQGRKVALLKKEPAGFWKTKKGEKMLEELT